MFAGLLMEPRLVLLPNLQSPAMVLGRECGGNVCMGLGMLNFMEILGDEERGGLRRISSVEYTEKSWPKRWL